MYTLIKCVVLVSAAVAASSHSLGPNDVVFHLFTPNNPEASEPLLPNLNSILLSGFSVDLPTILTIHTNNQTGYGSLSAFIVPAHLAARPANVISVDWSAGSTMYPEGLANANQCGQVIATFMNIIIVEFGYSASQVRFVGHGLGAHVAAIAARQINGQVAQITALDPSLHGWTHHPGRLGSDAAEVVEVLHATSGLRGYDRPLGHFDFYPNGGTHQNGCGVDVDCSHTLAIAFYAESINAERTQSTLFVSTRCNTYDEAMTMQCTGDQSVVFGGIASKAEVEGGIFTFSTNAFPPFARG